MVDVELPSDLLERAAAAGLVVWCERDGVYKTTARGNAAIMAYCHAAIQAEHDRIRLDTDYDAGRA